MRFSINSIGEINKQTNTGYEITAEKIEDLTKKIGAQLGEIEQVVSLAQKYEGILVVNVVSCADHPNADKLKLCKIDDGGVNKSVKRDNKGLIQVVCGAPNVTQGMLAAWIPPGSNVPATFDKEPFVIESREIRGELSNGMLASPSELDINDDHSGLLKIDKQANPGDSFAKVYKLDDTIIDIENKMFTHRPDCFGLLGIARELSGIHQKPFISPEWYKENPAHPQIGAEELKLEITNEIPQLVPRFTAIALKDVNVAPSPLWLQVALSKLGAKSINNVVDYTNFFMFLTGQPIHAYDYDKVAGLSEGDGAVIKIRLPKSGEKLKLLNGKEIAPSAKTIMIATDKKLIGVGGVIGGSATEVDNSTKNIIIECANFDSNSIRRTSMEQGIFTDAVTRFSKGQSPRQNLGVITKVAGDIQKLTGGKVASKTIDIKGKIASNTPVELSKEFINSRLGISLDDKQIAKILGDVEFEVDIKNKQLSVTAPFWRTDIEIPEDIVEEVGRLYGYDHLPLVLPKKPMSSSQVSEDLQIGQLIRDTLSALGSNELLNYSFVHGDLLKAAGQSENNSYKIKNALSPDLQYYRQSLIPSLLEKIHPNIKSGYNNFALFEIGKVHIKGKLDEEGLPNEFDRVALVVAAKNNENPAYYTAVKYLTDLLAALNVNENSVDFEPIDSGEKDSSAVSYYEGRSATVKVGGEVIGRVGEYAREVTSKLKLPEFCAGFELGLEPLRNLAGKTNYVPASRYPSIAQDICFRTNAGLTYAQIRGEFIKSLDSNSPEDVSFDIRCIDIFEKGDGHRQTTFHVSVSSTKRTLATQDMNNLLGKVAEDLQSKIKAAVV